MLGKFNKLPGPEMVYRNHAWECRQGINELQLMSMHVGLKLARGTRAFCVSEVTADGSQEHRCAE